MYHHKSHQELAELCVQKDAQIANLVAQLEDLQDELGSNPPEPPGPTGDPGGAE
jgi:hypothetical protein